MPGEKVWLVGEHHSSGERKRYLPTCLPTRRSEGCSRNQSAALICSAILYAPYSTNLC